MLTELVSFCCLCLHVSLALRGQGEGVPSSLTLTSDFLSAVGVGGQGQDVQAEHRDRGVV